TILPLIITAYYYLITNAQNINIDDHRKAILLSWLQGIGSSILILGLLSQISVSLFSEFKGARAVDSIAGELGRNPETSVQEQSISTILTLSCGGRLWRLCQSKHLFTCSLSLH